jgi:lysophospholipase L1-like esterase
MTARGIVALGDSITRGKGGAPALGVHPQPWVQWLAEAMDAGLWNLAVDGATAADLVRVQLPRVAAAVADHMPAAGEPRPFDLATLFVGANDARGLAFDAAAFEDDVDALLRGLTAAADRVLVLTVPLDLGRPRAGHDVIDADAALRRQALAHGAVVCGLEDLRGPRVMLPDAVHPTSPGMVAIADRAAAALGLAVRPSVLAEERTDLRARAGYAGWWARQALRDARRRRAERH